jgi:hypothetical protein
MTRRSGTPISFAQCVLPARSNPNGIDAGGHRCGLQYPFQLRCDRLVPDGLDRGAGERDHMRAPVRGVSTTNTFRCIASDNQYCDGPLVKSVGCDEGENAIWNSAVVGNSCEVCNARSLPALRPLGDESF